MACQDPDGGLRDKPGKYVAFRISKVSFIYVFFCRGRDYYHTCYALSGLSIAQHNDISSVDKHTVHGGNQNNLLVSFSFAYFVFYFLIPLLKGTNTSSVQYTRGQGDKGYGIFL